MPIYTYICSYGHCTEKFLSVEDHTARLLCRHCGHGRYAEQIITAPILVKASADVCYDSPIDGKPITSHAAREEDLKRNGCTPYDPESKTDYTRRIKDSESALDKQMEATVEEAIEKMPTAKRGKLYSELTEQGMTADVVRTTPHA